MHRFVAPDLADLMQISARFAPFVLFLFLVWGFFRHFFYFVIHVAGQNAPSGFVGDGYAKATAKLLNGHLQSAHEMKYAGIRLL